MPTLLPPRPIAPGTYSGTIAAVDFAAYIWRVSPSNSDGLAVRIAVLIEADDGPAHVVDSIDAGYLDRLAEAFAACGVPRPASYRQAEQLVGLPCRVAVKNITPRMGRRQGQPKACVSAWLATHQSPGRAQHSPPAQITASHSEPSRSMPC
jgi:hypothetical protein